MKFFIHSVHDLFNIKYRTIQYKCLIQLFHIKIIYSSNNCLNVSKKGLKLPKVFYNTYCLQNSEFNCIKD